MSEPVTFPINGRVAKEVVDWINSEVAKENAKLSESDDPKRKYTNCQFVSKLVTDHFLSLQRWVTVTEKPPLPPCTVKNCPRFRDDLESFPGGCRIYVNSPDNSLGNLLRCPDYCQAASRGRDDG